MRKLTYSDWCEIINMHQITLLILSEDPEDIQKLIENSDSAKNQKSYYEAVRAALYDSLLSHPPQVLSTRVHNEPIKKSLTLDSKGKPQFVFPRKSDQPDYLDTEHARYAPKLAAAVYAWLAMGDQGLTVKKSPRQGLECWLRTHADEYNLTDAQGRPKESAIKECARIANWKPEGGAPKSTG